MVYHYYQQSSSTVINEVYRIITPNIAIVTSNCLFMILFDGIKINHERKNISNVYKYLLDQSNWNNTNYDI